MPTALLIAAAFAVCVVLPGSAKEHRSASVKREFQLTHPCPATGRTSGACPGYVKDHVLPLTCGVASRKAAVVIAVREGVIGRRKACDWYQLSSEELASWEVAFKQSGTIGLRARYRFPEIQSAHGNGPDLA
jgi:hypothetical protein